MKPLFAPWIVTLAFVVIALASQPCAAAILANGGFEDPALALGTFQTVSPGGEPAGMVWTVTSGNVDIAHLPVDPFVQYSAYEGLQALDLNGETNGAIRQDFATTPGQQYRLTFAYADNPLAGGVSTASINVSDVGTSGSLLVDSISHSTSTNGPPADADWLLYSGNFTATDVLTRLAFASTSPDTSPSGGIILDAVAVTAVPEPTSLLGLSLGASGLLAWRRRRLPARPS